MEMWQIHPIVALAVPLLALVAGALLGCSVRFAADADAWAEGYECGRRTVLEQQAQFLEELPDPRLIGEE